MKKYICPNCGEKTVSFFDKMFCAKGVRFFSAPKRCPNCNGYYKLKRSSSFFANTFFLTGFIILLALFSNLLIVKMGIYGYISPTIILVSAEAVLICFFVFLIYEVFQSGLIACNHRYEGIEFEYFAECDIEILPFKDGGYLFKSSFFSNTILEIQIGENLYPATINLLYDKDKISGCKIGFIREGFIPYNHIYEGAKLPVKDSGKTVAVIKVRKVLSDLKTAADTAK